ncbi:MAG: VCBS repeat-containing protein [Verrucomicrobia bacterium]|nr:VCBS repeat-containing protein [Verrucomicrobiota bacterium]
MTKHFLMAASLASAIAGFAEELHTFKRIQLSDQFWCEGANFGDLNRDGVNDLIPGPWWWEGPDFQKRHEFYPATATFDFKLGPMTTVKVPGFEGTLGVANKYSDNFFVWVLDFNKDGWNDILIVGFPGQDTSWFENPKGKEGHWVRHKIFDQTDNESPVFTDLTGDGKPELVCITKGRYGYATPDWSAPEKPWALHTISPDNKYGNFTHGMGVGDVNGDRRLDLLEKDGWWEQPASLAGDPLWQFHEQPMGAGGSQMYAYDVNGDGLNDIITGLAAHGFGLAWYEQYREGSEVKFREHIFMNKEPRENKYGVKFSELHAIDLVDMDGDGVKDIVTGKRFWSHGRTGDPDRNTAAVLYWFKLARGADKSVDWIPYLIDDNSGVGVQVVARDMNGDGLPDIVVGNKKGTFIHLHEKKPVSREEWERVQPKPVEPLKPAASIKPTGDDGQALNLDFEASSLKDWTATGTAFDGMPAKGDAVHRRRSDMRSGHRGEHWVGSYETHGDAATGTLISAPFSVTQPYASFLVGGGSGNKTRVELVNAASGQVLFRASGPDDEKMRAVFADLRAVMGAKIQVRLVDEATTGWGHVNFDEFVFHDSQPGGAEEIKPAPLAANLPARVDLRRDFAVLSLTQRSQGARGTCSVFATVEAVEFAVARATGQGRRLSVEFANWAANHVTGRGDDGDFFHNIIQGIQKHGICAEAAMPYLPGFAPTNAPSAETCAQAAQFRDSTRLAFHWIKPWNREPGLTEADVWHIKSVLSGGWPVSAGSAHSVLFVGYEDDAALPGGGRFPVADSNLQEHDLSYEAARKRMCDLFWVTAEVKGNRRST